jgi:hypothetical protein
MEIIYNLFKFIEDKYPDKYRTPLTFKMDNEIPLTKEDLNVLGDFIIYDNPDLESLPEGLNVSRDINLGFCTSLISLPKGLSVGRDLDLEHCESLTSLPKGLKVLGSINLKNTPIAEKYTEDEIREMYPGIKGKIYL